MASLDVSTDFQIFDNKVDVVVWRRDLLSSWTWRDVVRRELSTKEAEKSDGQYRAGDILLSVPVNASANSATEPMIGDVVSLAGKLYDVLVVMESTLGSRWKLILRGPDLGTATTRLRLYEDSLLGADRFGAPQRSRVFVREFEDARLHPEPWTETIEQGRRMRVREVRIFLKTEAGVPPIEVGPEHWFEDQADSKVYRVLAMTSERNLGEFYVVRAALQEG